MLTRVDYADAAGINNIEWDAVELPSQFMENWCYHRHDAARASRATIETGAPLPAELFEQIAGGAHLPRRLGCSLRQLYFATLDLELHHRFDPERDDS